METKIWVEINSKQKDRLFLKCFKNRIEILETKEKDSFLYLKIYEKDYAKLKHFWFIKVKKKSMTGLPLWKEKIYQNRIFFIAVIMGLIILYMISHIMIKVEVIHSNKEIRDFVTIALKEKGVKENTWRKSYEELESIKKAILEEYPDRLEWMEIEVHGMNYVIRIEERKIEKEEPKPSSCNVIATKDGLVKEMILKKGEAVVTQNDSVKKGTILISGNITKDNETKETVCADGEIYAEVWYQVTVSVPLEYEISQKTKKTRWNFRLQNLYFDDLLLKSRLTNYEEERKKILSIFGNTIYFVIQHETTKETRKYTEEEASNLALAKAIEKIQSTFTEKERILDKKVLKKERNNSTMNIEVFVSALESIGEIQKFEEKKE